MDRQLQAWLRQFLVQVNEPTRTLLEQILYAALQARVAESGDTEVHRLLSALDHLRSAQRLRVNLPPRWSTISQFIENEVELEQLTVHDDQAIAAGALLALAKMYRAHSDHRQAARAYLRLQSLMPGELPSGASIAEAIDDIPVDSPAASLP